MKREVRRCPRCGDNHGKIEFTLLSFVSGDYTHYSTCPKTQEPILASATTTELGRPATLMGRQILAKLLKGCVTYGAYNVSDKGLIPDIIDDEQCAKNLMSLKAKDAGLVVIDLHTCNNSEWDINIELAETLVGACEEASDDWWEDFQAVPGMKDITY